MLAPMEDDICNTEPCKVKERGRLTASRVKNLDQSHLRIIEEQGGCAQ